MIDSLQAVTIVFGVGYILWGLLCIAASTRKDLFNLTDIDDVVMNGMAAISIITAIILFLNVMH